MRRCWLNGRHLFFSGFGRDQFLVAATAQRRDAFLKFGNYCFAFCGVVQRFTDDRSRHVSGHAFRIVIDSTQLIQELRVLRFVRILQHPMAFSCDTPIQ